MLVSADTSDLGPEMWGWARLGSAFWGGGSPPAMGEKAGRGGQAGSHLGGWPYPPRAQEPGWGHLGQRGCMPTLQPVCSARCLSPGQGI